jgi:hypothetical protein
MTNAFSSMEYPHWLMVAGAVLLVLGFIGMALRQSVAQDEFKEMATGAEEEQSESEAELAQTQAADRKERLAEQRTERWDKKDLRAEEPLNHRPKVSEKETE